jgi:hypothetical protein
MYLWYKNNERVVDALQTDVVVIKALPKLIRTCCYNRPTFLDKISVRTNRAGDLPDGRFFTMPSTSSVVKGITNFSRLLTGCIRSSRSKCISENSDVPIVFLKVSQIISAFSSWPNFSTPYESLNIIIEFLLCMIVALA